MRRREISQKDLAAKIPMNPQQLNDYLNEKHKLPEPKAIAIATALDLSLEEVLSFPKSSRDYTPAPEELANFVLEAIKLSEKKRQAIKNVLDADEEDVDSWLEAQSNEIDYELMDIRNSFQRTITELAELKKKIHALGLGNKLGLQERSASRSEKVKRQKI